MESTTGEESQCVSVDAANANYLYKILGHTLQVKCPDDLTYFNPDS